MPRCTMRVLRSPGSLSTAARGALTLALVIGHARVASAQLVVPTPRREHVDRYPGFNVSDPYRWLEDVGSAETRRWVRAQDSVTRTALDSSPERAAAAARLTRGFQLPDTTTLIAGMIQKRGSTYFVSRVSPGRRPAAIGVYTHRWNGPGRELKPIVPGALAPAVGWVASPDGRYVAYVNSREGAWHVIDVESGRELSDSLVAGPQNADSIAWTPDGTGFYYTRHASPANSSDSINPGPDEQRIYHHRVGTPQDADAAIFSLPNEPKLRLRAEVTDDGSILVITASKPYEAFSRVHMLDRRTPGASVRPLFTRGDQSYVFLGLNGGRLLFSTTEGAPRGRIVSVDPNRPATKHWRTVVPQIDMTINRPSLRGNRLLVLYNRNALPWIRIYDIRGRLERELPLPGGGMGSPWWNGSGKPEFFGSASDPEVQFLLISPFTTPTWYSLDVATGGSTRLSGPKPSFSAADFEIRQVFYPAKDSTLVPMLLVHRRGLQQDSTTPVVLSTLGGAFGWSSFYWFFQQSVYPVWLEMGGVVALPGARGGYEYGMNWRLAGYGSRKQTSIDDFISAAEWLIARGYGSRRTLVLEGANPISALGGAVLNQRPELFAAAIMNHPLFDMLRLERLPGGWVYAAEFGSAANPREAAAVRAYSPYHNVRAGVCYPPTLVMTGENDTVDFAAHAYKQVAAWQHAQRCANPIRLVSLAGQGYAAAGSPPGVALQLAFLTRALGLAPSRLTSAP